MKSFYGTTMPRGEAGLLTRGIHDATIETHINDGTVKEFGIPVKRTTEGVGAITSDSDVVLGFVVHDYHQQNINGTAGTTLSIMKRGYCSVKVKDVPNVGGQVNVTSDGVITAGEGKPIPFAVFKGKKDANEIVEIEYKI